jgi:predicted nucleic acid-binding protein
LCSLWLNNENNHLILDDLKARKIATNYKIKYTGTLGVLIAAKKTGLYPFNKTHPFKNQ